MKVTHILFSVLPVVALSVVGCERQEASAPPDRTGAAGTPATNTNRAPDNTARNERDREGVAPTPIDQSQATADVEITAAIRRAIMEDKSMSVNAQNVKVITQAGGVVTLRGVVNSQAEKDAIAAKAQAVAGVTRVDNLLEVKPA